MNAPMAPTGIRFFLWFGFLGSFILTATVPVQAVTYAYNSPLSFMWADASGPVDHYNVYLSVDGQPFELMEEVGAPACQVDVVDGRTYVLQVEAEDAIGRVGPMSDPSDQVEVHMDGSPNDTDGDGMTNAWEASYGLNPFDASDAGGDLDSDGLANLEEFNAGTDPTDPDSDDDGVPDGQDQAPQDPTNNRPVADAGEDQELDPTVVTLDGSGSHDPNGDLLSYAWTQEDGPEATLSDSHTVSPAFLGTEAGEYIFKLVVNDGPVASLPDEVVVLIRNVPPSADAGPDREVYVGMQVVLYGNESADSNGDPLTYAWTQTLGTPVSLQGAGNPSASLVPIQPGAYAFQLVTSDGSLSSAPDEVLVIVHSPDNHVPTADAGADRTAKVGRTVTLNGSASFDMDGDGLSYVWSQTDGPQPVVLQGAATAQATFEAPEPGFYRFQLIVSDGVLSSAPDTVTVNAESASNRAPVAAVTAVDPVAIGSWVTLNGSGSSDPDLDPLTYSWTQTGGPQVMLEDGGQAVAGFYAVTQGTLVFALVVHDGESASFPASVEVQVVADPPDQVDPPPPPIRQADSDDGGGCSVALRGEPDQKVDAGDISYVLTLFLPAMGAAWYQKRRYRRRKGANVS